MSDEEIQIKEDYFLQLLGRFTKFVWASCALLFAAGGWAATQELRLRQNAEADAVTQNKVENMEKWKVGVEATRYRLSDHVANEQVRTQEKLVTEKRIQRLEDNQIRLTETLQELNTTLQGL